MEYHHIIEWSEREHFDPDHMVVLCPTHHNQFSKLPQSSAYKVKRDPFNIRHGLLKGCLVSKQTSLLVDIGGIVVGSDGGALKYCGVKLFGARVIDGIISINLFVPDKNFQPDVNIVNNDMRVRINSFWDIEFRSNYVKFKKRNNRSYIEIDLRRELASLRGRFEIYGEEYRFTNKKISIPGWPKGLIGMPDQGSGLLFDRDKGIDLGPSDIEITPPNLAMSNPKPIFLRVPDKNPLKRR